MNGCARRGAKTPPSPQPSPAGGRGGEGVQVFDVAIFQDRKVFFLLDEETGRLLSEPQPDGLGDTEAAIAFLKKVWGGSPPQRLVMDGAPLGRNIDFWKFLTGQGVLGEILSPYRPSILGRLERAIGRLRRRGYCPVSAGVSPAPLEGESLPG